MRRVKITSALGTGILALAIASIAVADADQQTLAKVNHEVLVQHEADYSLVTPVEVGAAPLLCLVPLPPDATSARLESADGQTLGDAPVSRMRGRPLARIQVSDVAALPTDSRGEPTLTLRHDGNWSAQPSRAAAYSRGFADLLGDSAPLRQGESENGTYLVISGPAYEESAEALAEWKMRKGFETRIATTDETGTASGEILAWLKDAYATWDRPPEYVLLLGDVDDIPAWNFSGNVSDLPYTLLDGDDWLPDVMLGRLSVESSFEAETVVAKTIAFERDPGAGQNEDWFTRSLMVGGNYGSETPVATVTWCGEQLETIGFEPASRAIYPPLFNGVTYITSVLETGVSIVTYRGWAYGINGWEPPHFTSAEIPAVNNGTMTPIVMSFVCLNGDFSANDPCFGEVFMRQGTPEEPKGAVAFIGNGEHWSHTRFNDAMAISVYERIVDEDISTMGQLLLGGKMRFMDYFTSEMDETGDEESVEFYFYIYNLLGDPELNFWKSAPATMLVEWDEDPGEGSVSLPLTVHEADGVTPVVGARVGLADENGLLASSFTGDDGAALLLFDSLDEETVYLTVTAPGHRAHEAEIEAVEKAKSLVVADTSGSVLLPAANTDLALRLLNVGSDGATSLTGTLSTSFTGVTVVSDQVFYGDIASGSSDWGDEDFRLWADADLPDGLRVPLTLTFSDAGFAAVGLEAEVSAPDFTLTDAAIGGDGLADPGEAVVITLSLTNDGRQNIGGASATLTLAAGGEVTDGNATLGAIDVGASGEAEFAFTVGEDVAVGTGLAFELGLVTDANFEQIVPFTIVVGDIDIGAPVGPDTHGYYIYDSADIDYPAKRPDYEWAALSPRYGGTGEEVDFPFEGITALDTLPFVFRYYGQDFDQIRISDNGWISFDLRASHSGSTPDNLDFYNWPLPNEYGNHSMIAPFWDNFSTNLGDSIADSDFRDGIYTMHADDRFIIEWSQMRHYKPEINDFQTFQCHLLDPLAHPTDSGDGEIIFLYKQVANTDWIRSYATVGMEDPSETDGLQFSYCNEYAVGAAPLSPGLALRVTTEAPVYDPLRLAFFEATSGNDGISLRWLPSDDRPVTGWRIMRVENGVRVPLHDEALGVECDHFLDATADPDEDHEYAVVALHPWGQETVIAGADLNFTAGPTVLTMLRNEPNPVRDATWLAWSQSSSENVAIRIFDTRGRLIRSIRPADVVRGENRVRWDGRNGDGRAVASGVYLCRLEAGGQALTRKLMVLR